MDAAGAVDTAVPVDTTGPVDTTDWPGWRLRTGFARSTERGIRPPSEWCALRLGACVGDDEFASWIVITGQALFFSVTAVSVIPGEDDWHTQCVPLELSTIQGGTLAKDFLGRNKHIPSLD